MTWFKSKLPALKRFAADESGVSTVEFAIVFPFFLMILMASFELSFVTLKHAMLERGLDMAVRDIRLGTGAYPRPTHDQIKQQICDEAAVILDCEENLKLEMVPMDLRAYSPLNGTADCVDAAAQANPVYNFTNGGVNQLMVLRACVKYEPFLPDALLGAALSKDTDGKAAIVSMAAFVQEPL